MDRSVVVTGAGQGIGRACLDRLLADGWAVVGIELDEERAAQVESVVGRRGAAVCGDVAERETHLAGAARAQERRRSGDGSTTPASVREGRSIVPTSRRSVASST